MQNIKIMANNKIQLEEKYIKNKQESNQRWKKFKKERAEVISKFIEKKRAFIRARDIVAKVYICKTIMNMLENYDITAYRKLYLKTRLKYSVHMLMMCKRRQ